MASFRSYIDGNSQPAKNGTWGKLYQQSVYWYPGVLLALFAALAFAYSHNRWLRTGTRTLEPDARLALLVFGGAVTAAFLAVSAHVSVDAWAGNWLFVCQPVRLPRYLGYFILGIHAQQHGWFTPVGYNPNLPAWGLSALLSGAAYLAVRLIAASGPAAAALLPALTAVSFNLFCLSALIASVGFFQQHVNSAGRFCRSQARNAYGLFYAHPLVLYPLAGLLVVWPLPVLLKFGLLVAPTLILAWAVSGLASKHWSL